MKDLEELLKIEVCFILDMFRYAKKKKKKKRKKKDGYNIR